MENMKEIKKWEFKEFRDIQNKRIKEIYLALLLKKTTKLQKLKKRLLPQNTRKREIYNFAIYCIETLRREGFELFVHQLKNRNCERYLKSSEVPILETKITQPDRYLTLNKPLQGNFTFPAENLNKINILTTGLKKANSRIRLQIIDENGMIIREVIVKNSQIKNNGYISFTFKPIKESKGKLLFFRLESLDNPPVSIQYGDIEPIPELTLFYNNEPFDGSISFKAYADLGIQHEYDLWMLKNEITSEKIKRYKNEMKNFEYKPKISIIMPVYNVDKIWLEKAIDSVRNQLYTNWELCIADDASTRPHINSTLKEYSKKDSRIKVEYLVKNLGISGATNRAISLASGQFIGLLDHDDELTIDALCEVVKLLNKKPETDLIYSDEDKIDLKGKFSRAFFKPGWSPDLLISTNYICHFTVIRKKIIDKIEGFRPGFEGSQDHDLFLRVVERTNKVEHIPKILYHWRMIPGSTALSTDAKDYARISGVKALQDHFNRQKIKATVSDNLYRTNYLVDYAIENDPLVSIIIHFNDSIQYVKRCIDSIIQNEKKARYEILVLISDGEEKESFLSLDTLKKRFTIKIINYDSSLNISAINNFSVKKASGDYLLFLSNKVEGVTPNWLSCLLMNGQRKEIGCVGPKILNFDDKIKSAGIIFRTTNEIYNVFAGLPENNWTSFGLESWSRDYHVISPECLMIEKDKFIEIGKFDENIEEKYESYMDLCLRVYKRGYLNFCLGMLHVYSFERDSKNRNISNRILKKVIGEYELDLENGDPYHNQNLGLESSSNINIFHQK